SLQILLTGAIFTALAYFLFGVNGHTAILIGPTSLDWALSFHLLFNAGKRSVTLDFRDDAGKAQLWKVLEDFRPDALVQNYRHLDIARAAGVDPDAVRAHFPDIVYTHLNAYGNTGVWQERPGFEQVVQAVSGIQMSYTQTTKPKLMPTPVIDIGSGLSGAFATVLGLYHRARTGHGIFATTHLTRTAVLLQIKNVADFQREARVAAAREAGADVVWEPGQRILGRMARVQGGWACIAGPRQDLEAWLAHRGKLDGAAGDDAAVLGLAGKGLRWRGVDHWRGTLEAAGVADRVALIPVPRLKRLPAELDADKPNGDAQVVSKPFPGVDTELAFIHNPVKLHRTPMVDVAPPPMRGGQTREVLAGIGVEVPEGTGVSPYPPNKAFLPWLVSVIRWGYFAWRSGNI
ncbi:MAG: hypothetical protein EP329_19965, partial [Deltaproteobacteria bacterium]